MRNGIYRCHDTDGRWNPKDITIRVKATEKSYVLTLIEDRTRYPESLIEMLLGKSGKARIPKKPDRPGGHPFSADEETWFVIYPFQAGTPFLFELYDENGGMER